jgi:hypothetical protein
VLAGLREEARALREEISRERQQEAASAASAASSAAAARAAQPQAHAVLTMRWAHGAAFSEAAVRAAAERYGRVSAVAIRGRAATVAMPSADDARRAEAEMAKGAPGKVPGLRVTLTDAAGGQDGAAAAPPVPSIEELEALETQVLASLTAAAAV